jgi:hypothetical protein
MGAPGNPVRIRGVDYPSQKAAAEALGLKPNTIGGALRRGTIERAGLGHFTPGNGEVTFRGVTYPSAAAAARAYKVTPYTFRKMQIEDLTK